MKLVATILSLSLLFAGAMLATPVEAQQVSECRPLFGGGPSCIQNGDLTLDKKLRNPQTNEFIDHADITDPKFQAGQAVVFQLHVRNTSNRALNDVLVTDIMPQYITYTKGPGTYNRETNILTYSLEKLEAGQTQTLTVEGKVVAANALPKTAGALCVVNQATATQGRNTGSDNAQFCLQTPGSTIAQTQQQNQTPQTQNPPSGTVSNKSTPPVLPTPNVTTSPKTGPELLALVGLIPAAATGFYLRRKTATN